MCVRRYPESAANGEVNLVALYSLFFFLLSFLVYQTKKREILYFLFLMYSNKCKHENIFLGKLYIIEKEDTFRMQNKMEWDGKGDKYGRRQPCSKKYCLK